MECATSCAITSSTVGDSDGVLVVEGTGDLEKGTLTVGVQRRYTDTAGRIENAPGCPPALNAGVPARWRRRGCTVPSVVRIGDDEL